MPDYQKMYCMLFNAITDALTMMDAENMDLARIILIHAQQDAEEIYISAK